MDTDIRPLAVITGAFSGIDYRLAKRCTVYGFNLVVAAAIEPSAGNFRVPGVAVERTQVIAS